VVDIPCDPWQIDESGHPWGYLYEAGRPEIMVPGAIVVTGDSASPRLGCVLGVVQVPGDATFVRLQILPGGLAAYSAALRRNSPL